jgi:hypothetical protein
MTELLLTWFRLAAVFACVFVSSSLQAADGGMTCIQEIGVPSAKSYIVSEVPADARITFTVGEGGKAESVSYFATYWLQLELRQAFVDKAQYSPKCKGQQLTFEVRYEVVGEPTANAESVTRFLPPNKFVVVCHPVKGSVN